MCDINCKNEVLERLVRIDENVSNIKNNVEDHEDRIRVLEHWSCPKHKELAEDVQTLKTDMAVTKYKMLFGGILLSVAAQSLIQIILPLIIESMN